jgi:hypothetical protein
VVGLMEVNGGMVGGRGESRRTGEKLHVGH